jgi:hypothetical protein
MSDAKTIRKMVKPITVRCGAPGCMKSDDAIATYTDDAESDFEIVAPRGWTFGRPSQTKGDVVYGACPVHALAKS